MLRITRLFGLPVNRALVVAAHLSQLIQQKGRLMARSKFKHKRKRHKANLRLKRRQEREKEEKKTGEQAEGS